MGVGMIDLIARGVKDIWIHNNPNKAFFLKSFNKYNNSINETRKLPFTKANFGQKGKVLIPNFCDMYTKLILEIKISDFLHFQDNTNPEEFLALNEPEDPSDNFGFSNFLIFDMIEKVELYAGKLKIDSYDSLQLFNYNVEKTSLTTKKNLFRHLGYAEQPYINMCPGQEGTLLLTLPFDLIQPSKPLPTHLCRNSPLEIRIKYRPLNTVIYPRQTNPYRTIRFQNKANNAQKTDITLIQPYIKESILHVTGTHLPVNVIQSMLKNGEKYKAMIRPFITYDRQNFSLIDSTQPELANNCQVENFGVNYKVPDAGETLSVPFSLEFQNPVQTFHIYLQKRGNPNRLDFNASSDLSNVNIIQQLGLRVHGEVVYPDLDSRFYTRTTSYLTKGENLIDRSFYMPLNLYNKNSKNNYGFINYTKVNHSTLDFTFLGWESTTTDRSIDVNVIAKIYRKLEISYGAIKFHADFD